MPTPGEQAAGRCVRAAIRPAQTHGTNANDQPTLDLVQPGALAEQVNIDRTAERRRGILNAGAHGGWVDAERVGVPFQGCRLIGKGTTDLQRGEYLQAGQLGRPGQQVGNQQHTQRGDTGSRSGLLHVRAHPQHARAGRPDLSG